MISSYTIRRALRAPRVHYMRHKVRNVAAPTRMMLEAAAYGRPIYRFMADVGKNSDLTVDFGIGPDGVVVEAGAYLGDWAEKVSNCTGARVYAFEPSPGVQERLTNRLAARPNVVVLDFGLGARNETATLSNNGPGSTLHPRVSTREATKISLRDVTEAFAELDVDHIDLLHVNIEGGEYDMLERLSDAGWFPRIDIVVVQFHEWLPKAHRRRRGIRRALRRTHTLLWDYPWVFEAWRRI